MKWKQSIGDTDCEHTIDMNKEMTTKQKRTFSGNHSHCTHCLCSHPSIAKGHTDATCYFLPPSLRGKETQKDKDLTTAKVAHVTVKIDGDIATNVKK